ncbi:hypothetical protein GALL_448460 [mine drainage metagenome]|jgi:hypothetical protein|uniref:Uncharacterized protein n=1 Tax=mine drainage metagenome TaxID=410659 RepID=A0A1J5PRU4_9ZZZZ
MDHADTDILELGLRIECAGDARLAHWLIEQVGADRVRLAAVALRARRAPSPRRVGEALGLSDGMYDAITAAALPRHATPAAGPRLGV